MRYISTRSQPGDSGAQFCDILLEGLAPDGGLYVPESYPQIGDQLAELRSVFQLEGYAGLALRILKLYIDDIPHGDLAGICHRAYNKSNFGSEEIVPVTELLAADRSEGTGLWVAHLSNGPSAAFKDMAMQLLGELFEYELTRRGRDMNILGATSGDTGSSAEYAMRGRPHLRVFMLTPAGRMTPFQQAQMFSLTEPNIVNLAVEGVFDDCQDLVKALFNDLDFRARYKLGAVNSINWARLVAQVIYYVSTWLRVTEDAGPDRDCQQVSFSVPTGNFGNICAGHIAKQMGLPIRHLILATNENDVLDEFFRTGIYRVRTAAETQATSSPSMDISKASNFERFIFDLLGRKGACIKELFGCGLSTNGKFNLSRTPEFERQRSDYGFVSASSTHLDRVATIAEVYRRYGMVIDPHTADAVKVGKAHTSGERAVPVVALETALPLKFSSTITEAIGVQPDRPARFYGIEDLPRRVIELPNDPQALKNLIAAHVDGREATSGRQAAMGR